MRLKNVAKAFDSVTARDAYSPSKSFKCQIEPLDLYRMDGVRVKVRGMDAAPGVVIPERRAVKIGSQNYLVSDASPDYWNGEPIRQRYVIQGADDTVFIRTIEDELEGREGVRAIASIDFNKYSTDERDSSDYHAQYHIFTGPTEPTVENTIVATEDRYFLVRNAEGSRSGLRDALANQIDGPVIDAATYSSRTYDPVTDTYASVDTTVRCIRVRWQEHFLYLSPASEKFERGDMMLLTPLSLAVKSGDRVTLTDGAWEIRAVVDRGTYRQLHVRRAL